MTSHSQHDRFQRSWFRLISKNFYLEKRRQDFQTWVGKIFELAYPGDYLVIRLTQGDGGLDGILLNQNAVVAVYAPRDATNTSKKLESKIKSDFEKAKQTLKQHNADMKKFIFVHNDEGLTKEVGTFLLSLRQQYSDITTEVWTFERLWKLIDQLKEDDLRELLGVDAPTKELMDHLEMPAIREVVEYLVSVKRDIPAIADMTIPAPQKLEYNSIDDDYKHLLLGGRSKHYLVQKFFDGVTDPTLGESIAEGFRVKYLACRESGMSPDDIFEVMWNLAGGNHFTTPLQLAGVTAVLSHFFSSCDIFENVPESEQ
ncbi:ABC-three component system protein [Lacunimicrobium album]